MSYSLTVYVSNYEQQMDVLRNIDPARRKGPVILNMDNSITYPCVKKVKDAIKYLLTETNYAFIIENKD